LGGKYSKSRSWAHRLRNSSMLDDEGLVFFREARISAEHGLEPFANFYSPSIELGGAIKIIGGHGSMEFKNLIIDDGVNQKKYGKFVVTAENDGMPQVSGGPVYDFKHMPAGVLLMPINSTEKNKTFPVPRSLMGMDIVNGDEAAVKSPGNSTDPFALAECGLRFLRRSYIDLSQLLSEESEG
jgi:hypothetical protein